MIKNKIITENSLINLATWGAKFFYVTKLGNNFQYLKVDYAAGSVIYWVQIKYRQMTSFKLLKLPINKYKFFGFLFYGQRVQLSFGSSTPFACWLRNFSMEFDYYNAFSYFSAQYNFLQEYENYLRRIPCIIFGWLQPLI